MRGWQGQRWAGAVVVLALGVAGCGDDGGDDDAAEDVVEGTVDSGDGADGSQDGGQPSTDVTVSVPEEACGLLSTTTVEDIAGEPTTPAEAESAFGDDFGPSSRCTWSTTDFLPPVELTVTGNPALFEHVRSLVEGPGSIEVEEVTDVGDEAFVFEEEGFGTEVTARQGDVVVQVRATEASGAEVIALTNEALLNL